MGVALAVAGGFRRRLALGLASSAMSQGLAAGQAIVLVPLFVLAWDADQYGRWLALTAIASHLTIADLGGQTYVANLLAMHFGRGEDAEFRVRLSEAVSLFLLIGLALLVLLTGGVVWAAWAPAGLAEPLLSDSEAVALLLLGALAVGLSVPGGVYGTAYRASGQFARGAVMGNLGRVATIAGCAALLAANASPAAVAGWMFAAGAATTLAIVIDSRRVIPACRQVRLSVALAAAGFRRLMRGSLQFGIIAAAAEVNQRGVLLVLAALMTPAAVAVYATHLALAGIPASLARLAQAPVAPELSFLWARRQHDDLARVALLATTTLMAVGALVAAAVWVVAPAAYGAWTSHELPFDLTLMGVLLLQSLLASGWQTTAWTLLATNQHHALARWSAVRAGLTVALAWWLAGRFGVVGVALAGLTADVLCGAVMFPISVSAMLGVPVGQFYRRLALGLVPLLPLALSVSGVIGGYLELTGPIIAALLTSALALAVASPSLAPVMRSLQPRRLG